MKHNIDDKICYLVGAGDNFKKFAPAKRNGDYIIAVDGGLDFLLDNDVTPDMIIGDFDSTGLREKYKNEITLADKSESTSLSGPEFKVYPAEKDYADMFLAAEEGFKKGYTKFVILGGTGKRFAHTMANIQLLAHIAKKGGIGYLLDDTYVSFVICDNVYEMSPRNSGYISIFSLSDTSESVTIKGLKYEIENTKISNLTPFGLSNEYIGQAAVISGSNASLLIITSHEQ